LFERAIALDPNCADPYRWLALSQNHAWAYMNRPMDPFRRLSMVSARGAAELDPDDSASHLALAYMLLYERSWEESASELYGVTIRESAYGTFRKYRPPRVTTAYRP
jgi:hypothetical protein